MGCALKIHLLKCERGLCLERERLHHHSPPLLGNSYRKKERERKSVSLSLTTVLCGIEEVGGLAYSQVRDVGSTWRMN